MKKYEYKFVRSKPMIGIDYDKKVQNSETEWNELGKKGWKFCKEGNKVNIFIRVIED